MKITLFKIKCSSTHCIQLNSDIVFCNVFTMVRFDENSDLSTTYLGRVDKGSNSKLKAEESFPITEHGYTQ